MAGAPQRVGKKWVVRWWFQGTRWSRGEEFEADARMLSDYISALGDRILPDDPRLTERAYLTGKLAPIVATARSFLDVAHAYERTKTWSKSRTRTWHNTLRNHYADWADAPVEILTEDHLNEKWHGLGKKTWRPSSKAEPRPYADNTKIGVMEVGLQVLTFAHAKGMLGNRPNPAKSPHLAFGRTMHRPANRLPFREAEFNAILGEIETHFPTSGRFAVADTQHADTAATMAALGLRIGEVLALAVEDVDAEEMVVWIGHKIERGDGGERARGTKSGRHVTRPVAIDEDFLAFIKPYIHSRSGKAPLFPGVREGKFQHPDEWRSAIWTPAATIAVEKGLVRSHIDHVPQAMRYSMGNWMRRHAQVRTVGERFGHANDKTTLIYLPPDLEIQREAMTAGVPKSIYVRRAQ